VAVAEVPETRFAETPGGRIAYQVVGDGPIDVLVTHTPLFPIDLMWDEPSLVRFLDRLSTFSRHVWFDPRGRGASDPVPHVEERFDEAIVDDMLASSTIWAGSRWPSSATCDRRSCSPPRTPSAPRRWCCSTLVLAW
jgi:hypothetical protein